MKNKVHILTAILSFCVSFVCYAEDIRIPAKGNNTYSVTIVDRGEHGARYDANTESIINTSNGTKIRIKDIDFGDGKYGIYNQFFFEYSCPENVQEAYFDIFIEDTTTPFLSIPISTTKENEFIDISKFMNFGILGNHDIYIKWRNHSASLKTIGLNELKPIAKVNLVRTGSLSKYELSSSQIEISGKQKIKMIWKGNNANVKSIILGNTETSISSTENQNIKLTQTSHGIILENQTDILKLVEVYSINGICIFKYFIENNSIEINLNPGAYIIKTYSGIFKILI